MRGALLSTTTNTSIHFLLLRTTAVPSPIPHRRRFTHRNPPIEEYASLKATASSPRMESIMKNGGGNETKQSEEKEGSPTHQPHECSSLSSDQPPQPPEKPEPGDCCGNGCFPCVWDSYYEELEAYTKNLEAYNDRVSSQKS
ncbi:uncharacterized protein LOC110026175 [Phalaenopsis equestris]|uniref:uncharacterized protein LOC110026175 n=1 Tax=Phalaenopsis equestris TaxID=78828 RepID=UPI0009E3C465|nr:uncharacterized protein LOC110026175 [Phalaenopsis equestris]